MTWRIEGQAGEQYSFRSLRLIDGIISAQGGDHMNYLKIYYIQAQNKAYFNAIGSTFQID